MGTPENPLYGHCDTCGANCGAKGCLADPAHVAAIDPTEQEGTLTMGNLTKYDTGEVLEPVIWASEADHCIGNVDFDNDEGVSILTIRVVLDEETGGYVVVVRDLTDTDRITIQHEKLEA